MRTARVPRPHLLLQLPIDISSVGSSSEQSEQVSNLDHQMSVVRGRGVPSLGRGVRSVPMSHAQGTLRSNASWVMVTVKRQTDRHHWKHYLSATLFAIDKHVKDGPIQLHGKPVTIRSKFHLGRRLHSCKCELTLENSDKLIRKRSESI